MADDNINPEFVNDPAPWPVARIDRVRPTEDVPLPGDVIPKRPLRMSHLFAEDVGRIVDALQVTTETQTERVLDLVNTLIRDAVASYENSITWDTTCLNCSNLMDQIYELDMKLQRTIEKVEDVITDRHSGDFAPLLPKLARIVREER
jgi:hypothetical protein